MLVSVALAAYNGSWYIRKQLNSILLQTFRDFELVVCDDASTDDTWDILCEYQEKDKRVRCYRNDKNLGFVKNFEKAAQLCGGDFIALSDQDDIWSENHLEVLIENRDKASLVFSESLGITADGSIMPHCFFSKNIDTLFSFDKNDLFFFTLAWNFAQGCTMLVQRDLMNAALPFPDDIDFHDHWLSCVALVAGSGLHFVDTVTVYYRHHGGNVYARLPDAAEKGCALHEKNQKWTASLITRVSQLFSRYKDRLSNEQKALCDLSVRYHYWIASGVHLFKRIAIFIKYYNIAYYKNSTLHLIIMFLPRLLKRVFFPAKASDLQSLTALKSQWDALYTVSK